MRSALLAKFAQHERLRRQLLATGEAVLISDSNCDSYWLEREGAGFNAIGKNVDPQFKAVVFMTIDPRLNRIVAAQPYPLLFATISEALLIGTRPILR